jgi:hypothetical protein
MFVGWLIGLASIAYFLLGSRGGRPEWGPYWMVQPFIITPLAGAMGGFCHYFIFNFQTMPPVNKTLGWIMSAFIFFVGIWMGIILGLKGTMWN